MIALAACTLRRDRKVLQALVVVKLALPARLVRPAPRAAQGPQGPVEESLGAFEKYLSDDSPSAQVSRSTRRSGGGLNSGSGFVLLLLFRAVGWAGVVAIVVVSLVPGDARPNTGLPGQIDHIITYCGTAGILGLGYPATKSRFGTMVMLISLAATLEVAQRWIPGRHPQFIDFVASVAGTCLGMLAAMVVHRIALRDLR